MRLPTQDRFHTGTFDFQEAPWRPSVSRARRFVLWSAVFLALAGAMAILYITHQREASDIREMVRQAALEEGIDPRLAEAVVHAESRGNARARSRAGALGLMQLMPDTARDIARRDVKEHELFDPRLNARLGCRYLRYLLRVYDGDLLLTLMAYNAGMGRVRKWREKEPDATPRDILARHAFPETRAYVAKVVAFLRARANPAGG